ncbi:hypothetical protein RirG_191740 [Rhizophagus irregularis DAOM 197198w]|uniref:Uncharacterized protein n=1 Tax=Rhizophagus irregularis (strain DAOM 197198w) TaxID=1432141 RepID=A0A015KHL0_RHIIW|nr:hypothetical protein RirG_191740 [Rhizophagus irregularis DAOM 197198w]
MPEVMGVNELKKHEINDSDEEWEDWNSEVEDAMDDNDIISVDEYEGKENISFIIDITGNENVNFTSNKRRACNGLCSASISEYIERTPAKFGGSCHIEVIAKEIWPNKFKKGFSRKRINIKEKRILNRQIYAESTWFIDRESDSVCAKECNRFVDKTCRNKICCIACLALRFDV